MPVVHVIDQRKQQRRLLSLVFPIRTAPNAPTDTRWEWPELRARVSSIQGFGLYTRSSDALDWGAVTERRAVALPYLGNETEVESSVQARVLRTVLCGQFDVVARSDLPCPPGNVWVQDGLYVTRMTTKERDAMPEPLPPIVDNPDEQLLQVSVDQELKSISYVEEGDEQVCYLLKEEARQLLHLPEHIFELLSSHAFDEHADRNMATHVVQFSRASDIHLLVSAHPLFRHSAFIMGCANEPPRGAPSLELLELRLTPAPDDDPLMVKAGLTNERRTLELFDDFVGEHPEVLMKQTFFVTRKAHFGEDEELTVVYGSSYKRTYNTWGHAGVPLRYHVPPDKFEEGVWESWAQWPIRCPGWFNVDQQPYNRPAFERVKGSKTGEVKCIPDLEQVVKARKLGLDGDATERRLAKIEAICWPRALPVLPPEPTTLSQIMEAEDALAAEMNAPRSKGKSKASSGCCCCCGA